MKLAGYRIDKEQMKHLGILISVVEAQQRGLPHGCSASPHPADDLLEPSPLAAAAALLADSAIPVDRAEDPSGQTVSIGQAAVFAAPSIGA